MKKRKPLNSATKAQDAQALKDFGAALEGKPSSYRSAPYAVPASAKQVREARKLSGLAQPAFALAIGASPATVRSWEQGQKQPMGVASKLLRLLLKHPGLIKELAGDAGGMVARG